MQFIVEKRPQGPYKDIVDVTLTRETKKRIAWNTAVIAVGMIGATCALYLIKDSKEESE